VRTVVFLVAIGCLVMGFATGLFGVDARMSALTWFLAAIALALVFREPK
jgi:hypothetical protein